MRRLPRAGEGTVFSNADLALSKGVDYGLPVFYPLTHHAMFLKRSTLALLSVLFLAAPVLRAESIEELKAREHKVQEVAKKVMGSVVAIMSRDPKKQGSGSGVIVQKDGLILTAAHVTAATGDELFIIFPDGRRVNGKALGANKG